MGILAEDTLNEVLEEEKSSRLIYSYKEFLKKRWKNLS